MKKTVKISTVAAHLSLLMAVETSCPLETFSTCNKNSQQGKKQVCQTKLWTWREWEKQERQKKKTFPKQEAAYLPGGTGSGLCGVGAEVLRKRGRKKRRRVGSGHTGPLLQSEELRLPLHPTLLSVPLQGGRVTCRGWNELTTGPGGAGQNTDWLGLNFFCGFPSWRQYRGHSRHVSELAPTSVCSTLASSCLSCFSLSWQTPRMGLLHFHLLLLLHLRQEDRCSPCLFSTLGSCC